MKIKNRESKPARIEMLPLIDIVFLLLVFFIYAMLSMAVHRGMELDLPESTQAEISKETPLSISIQKGQTGPKIFLGKQAVPISKLGEELSAANESPKAPQVLIFAERNLPYQQLYIVLDELHKNSINNISLQASSQ
ncbi:MAG TPA: biopolymer transporter ExbD [Desulfocapsa sulfexigens]|nr:biopolymer transporter ExbD [Desulfocapsa sulfexigens]